MVEKSGVEKFMVEKSLVDRSEVEARIEKSRVEMSFNRTPWYLFQYVRQPRHIFEFEAVNPHIYFDPSFPHSSLSLGPHRPRQPPQIFKLFIQKTFQSRGMMINSNNKKVLEFVQNIRLI